MPVESTVRLAKVMVTVAIAPLAQPSPQPKEFVISGTVRGASGQHTVHVAVWDEKGFLRKPILESFSMLPVIEFPCAFRVKEGRWAISAYEDRNENGSLDMGPFGPRELVGFTIPYQHHRKPRFADVAVVVDNDIDNADILLLKR